MSLIEKIYNMYILSISQSCLTIGNNLEICPHFLLLTMPLSEAACQFFGRRCRTMSASCSAEKISVKAAADAVCHVQNFMERKNRILTRQCPLGVNDGHGCHIKNTCHARHVLTARDRVARPADGCLQCHGSCCLHLLRCTA